MLKEFFRSVTEIFGNRVYLSNSYKMNNGECKVSGKESAVYCNATGKRLKVPAEIVGENELAMERWRHRTLENGVYVSPIGAFYSSFKEWLAHMERQERIKQD